MKQKKGGLRTVVLAKKGISPLIATVLLIGFTVALAAVLMTWGLDYIRGTTQQVGSQTEEYLKCSDLSFEITQADCTTGDITVQNNGDTDISGVILRVFVGPDVTVVRGAGIPAFANAHYVATMTGASKVDAIPEIKSSTGRNITCESNRREFVVSCP